MKLVVIGGGSSYTPELLDGIIRRRDTFPVSQIVLVDVQAGREKAGIIRDLLERMLKKAGMDVPVTMTLNRREALPGADFVVSQFRVGGLAARSRDERIPMKYGLIGQETTGAGGMAKALRTIPVILDICRDMEQLCPDAWLINFTNPSGIVTQAVCSHSRVRCVGLCNVPINMQREAANVLNLPMERVDCRFAGLNHLSFIGRLYVDGKDLLQTPAARQMLRRSVVKNIPDVALPEAFIAGLGFIPSSYLKYFYLERQMFNEQRQHLDETGHTRADDVMEVEHRLFERYRDPDLDTKPEELSKRGGAMYSEAAVSLMQSIWNDTGDVHVVNTPNRGALPELADGAVVETNCIIRRSGATPLSYGRMPLSIRGLVQQVKAYEDLTVQAAVEGSREKALLALMNNPLVHDAAEANTLLEELITANQGTINLK